VPALVVEAGPSAAKSAATLAAETGVPARVYTSIRAGVADWQILVHAKAAAAALGVTRATLLAAHRAAHTRIWGRAPHVKNNKPAVARRSTDISPL